MFNQFETQLMQLDADATKLQEAEQRLQHQAVAFREKLNAFLKENGLPSDFTLPQLALLAIRQSRKQ